MVAREGEPPYGPAGFGREQAASARQAVLQSNSEAAGNGRI